MVERKHLEALGTAWYKDAGFHEAMTAALAALDESPWRSMESAPRDGTDVDLMVQGEREPNAHYDIAQKKWVVWGLGGFDRMEWVDVGAEPTHWMPLPAAPEVPK